MRTTLTFDPCTRDRFPTLTPKSRAASQLAALDTLSVSIRE
jgi:hypothetical protein